MLALVHGRDGPLFDTGSDAEDRHEAHQAYMDGWLPRLLARGPTLSADGEEHTGSVHVVEVEDLASARRFASEEPYARTGWQVDVAVAGMLAAVPGTMWDRPRPDTERPAAFVRASWQPRPLSAGELTGLAGRLAASAPPWLFAGLLLDAGGDRCVGFAGAADLAPEALGALATALLGAEVRLEVHRWRRGGR